MSDFPDLSQVAPERLTSFDARISALGGNYGAATSALVSMTANQAIYVPFFMPWSYVVRRFLWCNGASGGNVDVGIYTINGLRLASVGGVATSGTQNIQFSTALGTPLRLLAGQRYFMAYVQSFGNYGAGGNTSWTAPFARLAGFYRQASAYPLPATATFATYTDNNLPMFGFTRMATGA